MCLRVATCLSVDCCFSELALYKSNSDRKSYLSCQNIFSFVTKQIVLAVFGLDSSIVPGIFQLNAEIMFNLSKVVSN